MASVTPRIDNVIKPCLFSREDSAAFFAVKELLYLCHTQHYYGPTGMKISIMGSDAL
jgi:hypothetical protein